AEGERGAAPQLALHPDAPTMRLHNRTADVEAKSSALRAARGRAIHTLEALEDALLLAQWDALAKVCHMDDHVAIGDLATHPDTLLPLGRVLDRVVEQVHQHLLDALTVGQRQWSLCWKAHLDVELWAMGLETPGDGARHLGEV